jgi:hypothetical protein
MTNLSAADRARLRVSAGAEGACVMGVDFLARREADLLAWSRAFSARISSDPQAYALTELQAQHYALLHAALAERLAAATAPSTRTRAVVSAKNEAESALRDEARRLARLVRASPSVSDEQRISLGLTPSAPARAGGTFPDAPPMIELLPALGRMVHLRLCDPASERRGLPPRVAGALVFTHAGAAPPDDVGRWKLEATSTRARVAFEVAANVAPGSQLWITACWLGPRARRGAMATPVCTYVGAGVSRAAA